MKSLIIIFCGILVVSCTKNSRNVFNEIVKIPQGVAKTFVTNELFDGFEFIPLETSEQCLLGDIKKIIIYNNKFYILDNVTKRITVFHSNGKYCNIIGTEGAGPEEYSKLEDFTIDEKNDQVIILSFPSIIFKYDLEGNFIERKKISDQILWHICYDTDNGFFCSTDYQSEERNYLIYHYDKDFKLIDKKIKSTNEVISMPPLFDPFIKTGDKISYFDFFNSTLHWDILNSEGKKLKFEFGNKKVPFEIFKEPMKFIGNQQNYDFFITAIFDDVMFWTTYSNHGQGANTLIIDINSSEKIVFKNSWFFDILCFHDGYFYQVYSASRFLEKEYDFTAKVLSNYLVDFDSNPVILRFNKKIFPPLYPLK